MVFSSFYPSDCRLHMTRFFKFICLIVVMIVLSQRSVDLVSLRHQLLIAPRFLICFPKRKVKSGFNAFLNQNFSLQCARVVLLCNTWVLFLMLLKSGDVHPNPGPNVSSESSFTSSGSDISGASALMDHLSIVHLNIQSLYPKLDILEVEMQYYDIVVYTETWLTQNRKNEDIMIPNFDAPYRKDPEDRVGGGIAIYIKSGISMHKLTSLIDSEVEGLCVEVKIRNRKFLLLGIYIPPNSGVEYWNSIERTFENLNSSPVNDLVILGDFNCNMQTINLPNRTHNLILSYDLCQLVDEPTHFTEQSPTIINLALVNDPANVLFSDVISPFIPNLARFHCPI